jgi:hypothetical protein
MADKIRCPHCLKMNEMQKLCAYCGKQMFDDNRSELMLVNPDPYCLNCGRSVEENQAKCDCGYELGDVICPECGVKNEYANRFCTDCGKKLWRADVDTWGYDESLFKSQTFIQTVLPSLHNTSLYGRCKSNPGLSFPRDDERIGGVEDKLRRDVLRMDKYLSEIASRWKIVSPNYCLSCLGIMRSDDYSCAKCGFFSGDKKRVKHLRKTLNNYSKPVFDIPELKWTSIYSEHFLGCLAPSIGESQFEYRERLKWEFAEVSYHKMKMQNALDAIERRKKKRNAKSSSTSSKKVRSEPAGQGSSSSKKVRHDEPKHVVDDGKDVVSENFPCQFQDFSRNVKDICRDNGGDISRFEDGIVGCPRCSNYFHYLSKKFIDTHKCPHCGLHFNITAVIYADEYEASGISYDEYVKEYYGFFDD